MDQGIANNIADIIAVDMTTFEQAHAHFNKVLHGKLMVYSVVSCDLWNVKCDLLCALCSMLYHGRSYPLQKQCTSPSSSPR